MNLMSAKNRKSLSLLLVVAFIVSLSVSTFAQEGIIALNQRVASTQKGKSRAITPKKNSAKSVKKPDAEKKEEKVTTAETTPATTEVVTSATTVTTDTQDKPEQNPITQPLSPSP